MSAKIQWAKGGEATVLTLVEDAVTLQSSVSSPPGSRIEGKTEAADPVRVKIHSSKKQQDGSFLLEGRVLDMTRAVREKIVAG